MVIHPQNLHARATGPSVHCGAPTGVGNRVRVRAPEARLDYRTGRAQAPAHAARPRPGAWGGACGLGPAYSRR